MDFGRRNGAAARPCVARNGPKSIRDVLKPDTGAPLSTGSIGGYAESRAFEDFRTGRLRASAPEHRTEVTVASMKRTLKLKLLISAVSTALLPLHAATLRPETLQAWNDYVAAAEARMQARIHGSAPFLWASESDLRLRHLRAGEIIAIPMSNKAPVKVHGGLIHDWLGAAYLPAVKLSDVVAVAQDYGRYKEFYRPMVVESTLESSTTESSDSVFHFSLLMVNNSLFARRALESHWEESYVQIDADRIVSTAHSISIREIEGYGSAEQRMLPENEGSGYLWRMYAISRLEQCDDGVYSELEVLALSRDIPAGLRWVVDPIIRRVSRGSLVTSLHETRAAVQAFTGNPPATAQLSPAVR